MTHVIEFLFQTICSVAITIQFVSIALLELQVHSVFTVVSFGFCYQCFVIFDHLISPEIKSSCQINSKMTGC